VGLGGPVLACVGGARSGEEPLNGNDAQRSRQGGKAEGVTRICYIIGKYSVVRITYSLFFHHISVSPRRFLARRHSKVFLLDPFSALRTQVTGPGWGFGSRCRTCGDGRNRDGDTFLILAIEASSFCIQSCRFCSRLLSLVSLSDI
jgi:hypothetical protein